MGQRTCPAALTCRLTHRLRAVLVVMLAALAKLRLCCRRQALQKFASQAQAIHIFVVAETNKVSHVLQAAVPCPPSSQHQLC